MPKTKKTAIGLALGITLIAIAVWVASRASLGQNFHPVLPGRIYRSGQLSRPQLERAIDRHSLRAVINLRGSKPGRSWYETEAEIARRRGVILSDLDFSSKLLPSRPAVLRLLELLETLPEPVLLHCSAGADRAGFASAVARIVRGGAKLSQARSELGLVYGHLPFGPSAEIGRFFDLYGAYLAASGEPDAPATFKRWLRTRYVPYVYSARIEALRFPEQTAPGTRMDVRFRITNLSPGPWHFSTSRQDGIKLGFRLRPEGEREWLDYDRAGYVARVIAPGETLELQPPVLAPRSPGRYWLKVDLVDENVTWFEDQGSEPLLLPLKVGG